MTAETKQKVGKAMIPIMAIYGLGASQGGINAGLATMGASFPDVGANIAYVVSIVALGMIPGGLLTGLLTGKVIKYRTSIFAAIVLYLISGCFPIFFPDGWTFGALLVSRFIFGFAVGWCFPLAQALVFKTVEDEHQRATWLGAGWTFVNIGSAIMEFAGGYLALVSWKMCFCVYLLGIIPLVVVIPLLKEPKNDDEQAAERAAAHGEAQTKAKIPPIAFAWMIMLTLSCGCAMPTILYCSFVVPDSAFAGIILSVMTIVGAVSGMTLGPCYKVLGKWLLPVGCLEVGILYAASTFFIGDAWSAVPYAACFLIGHWGFVMLIPGTSDMVTNLTPIGAATRAMGWNTVFHQMGCFIGTPIATTILMVLGSQNPADCLLPSAIILTALGVVYVLLAAVTKVEKYGENYGK